MKTLGLSVLILASALALAGCGRKNLPVARGAVTTPVGETQTPNENAPASAANFERASRISAPDSDLTVSPAEVTRNSKAAKKSFPLDFLLN